MQTCFQLTTMKKGSLSIAVYFQKIYHLSQILAAAEDPIKILELMCYILACLTYDFDPLVASLTTRLEPFSVEDLYAHLLTFEQRLERQNEAPDLANFSVHVAQRHFSNPSKPMRQFNASASIPSGGHGCGKTRGGHSFSLQSSFSNSSSNKPTCQVCHQFGHTVAKCYHRFNHAYQVPTPPSAFFTRNNNSPNMNWYPDTRSTNHLTNELSNLNIQAGDYTSNDQIPVGNGQVLKILHTGLALLPTPQKKFLLKILIACSCNP